IGSDSQRLGFLQTIQSNVDMVLSLVSGGLAHSAEAVGTAVDLVLRRKAVAAEALAAQRDALLGGQYPGLQGALRQWLALRMRIARKTLAGPDLESWPEHQQQLEGWAREKEAMEVELASQVPEMNLEKRLQQADRRAV